MEADIESRFEAYCEPLLAALRHADRSQPAKGYLRGLILPGERKSVEPMAARVHPENVRSAHQSMHHLVAAAEWDDAVVLRAVADQVLPQLLKKDRRLWWILDDTGHAKKGRYSVGVARQYCGRLGKTDNCQVAVSLSVANGQGSLPLGYRLYLPKEWTEDRERCHRAGVPAEVRFQTKGEMARAMIEAARAQGVPEGRVLADAAYGDEAQFRDDLSAQGCEYVLGVRTQTGVWWGDHPPLPVETSGRGRPRTRLKRDEGHRPIAVADLARSLPRTAFRTVSWREGTNARLSSRFARVWVRAAHRDRPRPEEWLLIEWPTDQPEPSHYWLSNLSAETPLQALVAHAKGRWMIERDYEELKSELGLSHYEGRNWRGFHHHATLCIAAYGFLMIERLRSKKNGARLPQPPIPQDFRPRGARPDAAPCAVVDCQPAVSPRTRHRPNAAAMSLLRRAAG